jgi:hypothetical protein
VPATVPEGVDPVIAPGTVGSGKELTTPRSVVERDPVDRTAVGGVPVPVPAGDPPEPVLVFGGAEPPADFPSPEPPGRAAAGAPARTVLGGADGGAEAEVGVDAPRGTTTLRAAWLEPAGATAR